MLVENVEAFTVGHEHMDADHRVLAAHLNKLEAAVQQGASAQELQNLLETVIVFTAEHFKREEALMLSNAYSGYTKHKAEHDTLLEEVKELQAKLNSGSIALTAGLLEYLSEWLNFHVVTTDKKLADSIASVSKV